VSAACQLSAKIPMWRLLEQALLILSDISLQLYEGESNENRKNFFKFNLLNESGIQLYHFST
jgi:hypothetical protein